MSQNFFQKYNTCSLTHCIKIKSGKPGPTLIISTATHGNEKVGVELAKIVLRNFQQKKIAIKQGAVYLLLANPKAYKQNKRFIDYDLNRSFLGNKNLDFYEHQRAQEIENYFSKKQIDYFLDFHSVSADSSRLIALNHRTITEHKQTKSFLNQTQISRVLSYQSNHIPGTMGDFFMKKDAFAVGLECGNHNNQTALSTAKRELTLFLNRFNIDAKNNTFSFTKIDNFKYPKIYETIYRIKVGPKFKWLVDIKTGTKMKSGEKFAFDNKNGYQVAPQDSILFIPTKNPQPNDFDAGFLCRKVANKI